MNTVTWTSLAELSFAEELAYIHKKWTTKEVTNFMNLVDNAIGMLAEGVIEGKVSKSTKLRSLLISKQTTMYFDFYEDTSTIELLLFWNNKYNPADLKRILKKC